MAPYDKFYAYNLLNNFPSLFQTTLNLAELGLSQKTIVSITFIKPSPGSASVTGIFALSGTPGPALPPFRLSSPTLTSGALAFTLATVANQSYTLQQTTNLAAASWQPYTNFLGSGAVLQFTIPITNRQQFFRLRQP